MLVVTYFMLVIRRRPRAKRTDTLVPYTTLCRSAPQPRQHIGGAAVGAQAGLGVRHREGRRLRGEHQVTRDAEGESRAGGHTVDRRDQDGVHPRSEEHTSELQSLMRTSYAVFCLKKQTS